MPPSGAATNADPSTTRMPSRIPSSCLLAQAIRPRSSSRGPARRRLRRRARPHTRARRSTQARRRRRSGSHAARRSISVRSTSPSKTGPRWSQLCQADDRRPGRAARGWPAPPRSRSCGRRRRAAGRARCAAASVWAMATLSVSRASSGRGGHRVAALDRERRAGGELAEVRAGRSARGRRRGRQPAAPRPRRARRRARPGCRRSRRRGRCPPRGSRSGIIGQRQKSSTGCRAGRSSGSAAPPARSPARRAGAGSACSADDLGAGAQRVADEHGRAAPARGRRGCRAPAGSAPSTGRSRRRRRGWDAPAAARPRSPPGTARASSGSRSRSPDSAWCSGGVPGGERQPGRVLEHLAVLEVLELRAADPHRRAHASPAARARARPCGGPACGSPRRSSRRRAPRRPSRRCSASSAATIALARSNSSACGVNAALIAAELLGVHRPLAVEAERPRLLGPRAEAVRVADRQIGPVDRLHAGSPGGHEHGLLRVQPQLRPSEPGGRPSEAARSA